MEKTNRIALRRMIYVIAYVVASIPLACGYVMEGGDILIWLARIEEMTDALKEGAFILYPSAELTVEYGAQISALHTNLWLLVPALFRMLGATITTSYRIYMLLLNLIAILSAKKLFEELFEDGSIAVMGVLLYMTCPYRIYICYDKASLGLAAAWSVIPLALWGIIKLSGEKYNWKTIVVSSAAFAAVGYADGILFFMTAGISVLGMVWYKKVRQILPLMAGGLLYLPGAVYMLRYLLKGGMEVWGLPLGSISSKGYVVGQFFSSWVYREDCPGLGLGLLMALTVLLWLCFTEGKLHVMRKYGYFVIIFILFSVMTLQIFPWDVVQRVAAVFLRFVPLMETPGICFGFASLAACVLGAYGVECAARQQKLFVKVGIPLMVGIAAVGIAVYVCNTLTYSRLPMFLGMQLIG